MAIVCVMASLLERLFLKASAWGKMLKTWGLLHLGDNFMQIFIQAGISLDVWLKILFCCDSLALS